ncbi:MULTISPECIES: thiolase family protein [Pseudomonas syringae group]|uniref:thiolase family protein n=1 Tax=Pseudomonas syringae group TaxID=136849 RepID=UPI0006D5F717|nr:thiolase family protein [Pseudomonas coronafaciens]KPX30388.1 Thiolase family protein [Pseudomonas coronafaciens pv. garcae]KPZ25550.1 Thiolase family protein [Pseudomonas coronafaciens pv. zizaniae]RMS90507.1 3-ketoacyl-CoA thiolase [Pseudomonas coronafaciens pv. oryzae]RMS92773.1 Thiolase protein [Pseudomonas coronafaciens pv. oryzae]RMV85579.1 Thiolase protein [Pseudomonas coronafaciens pv. garcae]
MSGGGQYSAFSDVAIVEAVRTPWVDLGGALAKISPIDLGIKVAREVLARAAVSPASVDTVLAGSMAQASFDAYLLPRHIGLYSGVPQSVPALGVQRICATGLELLRQAALHVGGGGQMALCVAAESMSRNPIAAYTHRDGFALGGEVQFKDFLWEALYDPAPAMDMIATADNLARRHVLSRETVDEYALLSHQRAMQSQVDGHWLSEIVPISNECFELALFQPRCIELPRGVESVTQDSHPRATSPEALSRLRAIHGDGVQTAGNSCAVVDGAAAALVAHLSQTDRPVMAHLLACAVVGVAPEFMGIGPVPAIQLLLQRSGLALDDIDRLEINEAQAAQVLAVAQTLELDIEKLNCQGGSLGIGHPLAATGLRLVMTLARQLREENLRYGIAAACVGGGQGMALLIENPLYRAFPERDRVSA